MTLAILVALIDDDVDVRDALSIFLKSEGFDVAAYASATSYLETVGLLPDVIVCDVRMPGLTGMELQRHLQQTNDTTPLILITGHGDIQMAIAAVKAGAYDYLEKPFDEHLLKQQILDAVDVHRRNRSERQQIGEIRAKISELSERQLQVMQRAANGATNKEIAVELGISPRTVEDYRAWVMQRLGAKNLAELVRLVTWLKAKSE